MGLDYSYRIFTKGLEVKTIIDTISRYCRNPLCCSPEQNRATEHSYETSILVRPDQEITEYFRSREQLCGRAPQRVGQKFPVGLVYVSIHGRETNTSEITFLAATTDMSILFATSPAIQNLFLNICRDLNAQYGFLDQEDYGYRLFWANGKIRPLDIPQNWNIDALSLIRATLSNTGQKTP